MRRARPPGPVAALVAILVATLGAAPALADPAASPTLAPPGDCAQPERELVSAPRQGAPPFDPAGRPVEHFAPGQVAAGPGAPPRPVPREPGLPRGGCDAPDAGCLGSLPTARGLRESPPQPGLPPGAGSGGPQ